MKKKIKTVLKEQATYVYQSKKLSFELKTPPLSCHILINVIEVIASPFILLAEVFFFFLLQFTLQLIFKQILIMIFTVSFSTPEDLLLLFSHICKDVLEV